MTPASVHHQEIDRLVEGSHADPHRVLGPHLHDGALTIRVLRPGAKGVQVSSAAGDCDLEHEHRGVWVGTLDAAEMVDYRLVVTDERGASYRVDDPYRHLPTLGEMDRHLIGEGRHEELWRVLGAQVREYDSPVGPVHGTSFGAHTANEVPCTSPTGLSYSRTCAPRTRHSSSWRPSPIRCRSISPSVGR